MTTIFIEQLSMKQVVFKYFTFLLAISERLIVFTVYVAFEKTPKDIRYAKIDIRFMFTRFKNYIYGYIS